ncbi:MAG: transcription antitermination factor NusB [candidate division WOR-3 bacterium]
MGTYPFTKRRLARALAVEVIYRFYLLGESSEESLRDIMAREDLDQGERDLLEKIVNTHRARCETIVGLLQKASPNWKPDRMLFIDRAIIEAAAAELMTGETPPRVVITEAIEIAKVLSTERSPGFVNGVLDGILRAMTSETPK